MGFAPRTAKEIPAVSAGNTILGSSEESGSASTDLNDDVSLLLQDVRPTLSAPESRILVVRPDRLGDVILSTPVFRAIRMHFPGAQITAMVRAPVAPIIRGLDSVDRILLFDPDLRHRGLKGFIRLFHEIKAADFGVAVVLRAHWKIALAIFLARVRYRIGPHSKLHSYLLFNRGLRQRRSHVEMHEVDYNLQLLRMLGIRASTRSILPEVSLATPVLESARNWLNEQIAQLPQKPPDTAPFILIHPGMGGSALNWPENHYQELIGLLVREGYVVMITAGPTETPLIDRFAEVLGALRPQVILYRSGMTAGVDFFGALCTYASVVVAPSTGPLHLAVALGKPVVTFYPPVRVQSAIRWGPYLLDENRASVMVPEVYCGQDFKCAGALCNYFPCMKGLTVAQAYKQVLKQISDHRVERDAKMQNSSGA